MSSAHLAERTVPGKPRDTVVTVPPNPWTLTVPAVAADLRKSESAVRRWCADGWLWAGQIVARKIGGEWMIHGARYASWLAGPDGSTR